MGASRLYVVDKQLRQITRDHSLVQEMVRMGEITAEEARNHPDKNIITRAQMCIRDRWSQMKCIEMQLQMQRIFRMWHQQY